VEKGTQNLLWIPLSPIPFGAHLLILRGSSLSPRSFTEQEALAAMSELATTTHLDALCDVGLLEDMGNG
jgi:hypothetical protein